MTGEPVSTGAIIALMAAGTAMEGYGKVQESKEAKRAAAYNAAAYQRDALAARQQAQVEEAQHRKQAGRLLSRQQALFAKAGIQYTGSPALVMSDTAAESELDALIIRMRGARQSQGFLTAAEQERRKGKYASKAGYIGAGATLLGGAASIMGAWPTKKDKGGK